MLDTRVTNQTCLVQMRLTERIALPSGRIVDVVPASATAVSLNVTAVDDIDRPIVTSTTLLGGLRLDIPWWVTPG